jgi:hypothetical protein
MNGELIEINMSKLKESFIKKCITRDSNSEYGYGLALGYECGFEDCFDLIISWCYENCKIERNDWALGNTASILERKREEFLK